MHESAEVASSKVKKGQVSQRNKIVAEALTATHDQEIERSRNQVTHKVNPP